MASRSDNSTSVGRQAFELPMAIRSTSNLRTSSSILSFASATLSCGAWGWMVAYSKGRPRSSITATRHPARKPGSMPMIRLPGNGGAMSRLNRLRPMALAASSSARWPKSRRASRSSAGISRRFRASAATSFRNAEWGCCSSRSGLGPRGGTGWMANGGRTLPRSRMGAGGTGAGAAGAGATGADSPAGSIAAVSFTAGAGLSPSVTGLSVGTTLGTGAASTAGLGGANPWSPP